MSAVVTVSVLAAAGQQVESETGSAQQSDGTHPGLLKPFNSLVGSWRGMGQPKRGSRKGAWQEKTVCRWDFSGDQPSIRIDADQGRQFERLQLTADVDNKQLVLKQRIDDTTVRTYRGRIPDKWPAKIRLMTDPDEAGTVNRCTVEQLSDIRLVMLFESRVGLQSNYRRVAGIGYTRSGHKLAKGNGNQRECVVTGGQGSIAVQHMGKTWYVCCEGCRQAFDDAPDEIIADYLARKN